MEDSDYHLKYIYVDSQTLATEGGYLFSPPSVVSLNLNAYMLDLPLKVDPRNTVSINVLQNSISYMDHTVLQLIDRQHVARTHLFHNAAYHLQYIFIDCQPIATEGGRYVQESHSIQFCRPEWKNTKQQGFHVWPANMLSWCSKQAAHISPILCRLRNSSPKTSLWTTESSIDFIHNRRVLANAFMSRCYKTAYPIRGILFYNLLTFNILQTP